MFPCKRWTNRVWGRRKRPLPSKVNCRIKLCSAHGHLFSSPASTSYRTRELSRVLFYPISFVRPLCPRDVLSRVFPVSFLPVPVACKRGQQRPLFHGGVEEDGRKIPFMLCVCVKCCIMLRNSVRKGFLGVASGRAFVMQDLNCVRVCDLFVIADEILKLFCLFYLWVVYMWQCNIVVTMYRAKNKVNVSKA